MISARKLADRLAGDYPQFKFIPSNRARWSSIEQTIYYTNSPVDLLHELGHAVLNHDHYQQDIELIQIELDAWNKARELAGQYGIVINDKDIEESLDSYRDWLYQRSMCPICGQNGIQSRASLTYYCINCHTHWQVNDARSCRLRRVTIKDIRK